MSHPTNPKYIVLAGGLTGGPIAPLLALAKYWHSKDERITPVIFDVKHSFGETVARNQNLKFYKITTGKLRRYWTWKNLFAPVWLFIGLIQSIIYLQKIKPKAVLGAGGFAQLPVMYAAWLLRIPKIIHQQDVLVTLSNTLCAPVADLITTTFEFSIRDFPQGTGLGKKYIQGTKVYWTGNPTSLEPHKEAHLSKAITLTNELPVLLVFGGASGAASLNEIIFKALPELTKVVQVLHITGPNKQSDVKIKNYHQLELSSNMSALYQAADIVLGRAGINTLTELAEFAKPSIIVPMPNTHQEKNAGLLYRTNSALVLDQTTLNTEILIKAIRKILFEPDRQKKYVTNMRKLFLKDASKTILSLIETVLDKYSGKHDKKG